MASLGGTSRGKGRDSNTSIAKAPAPPPINASNSGLPDTQNGHNDPPKNPSNTTPEIQDSQSDTSEPPNNAPSFLKPIHEVRAIIQNDLIKSLARTGKDSFDRHLQLQRTSPFWSKLFTPPPGEGAADMTTYRPPPLISREWAEYVVDASRIFFEAGVSVKKVVNIINRAIRFAAICLLNRGTEKIYFEDGRNVFYEFASCGMPKELKVKYKGFLKGMRDSILEGKEEEEQSDDEMDMEVKSESGDESSAASDVSQLEDAVTPAEDTEMIPSQEGSGPQEETTDILPWERSTTPTEVKPSTLNTVETSNSHAQPAKNPPQTKNERDRKRQNLKRKERRKRSLACLRNHFSESKEDTTQSKTDKRRRWRQNRKRKEKEKMKKLQDGLQGCNISA